MTTAPKPPLPPAAYSAEQVAEMLGLSVRSVYRALDRGDIPSGRVGSRRIVPAAAFDAWLARLNEQTAAS